jgi:hypothetical protein
MSLTFNRACFDASPPLFIAAIIFSRMDVALAIAPSRIDAGRLTDSGTRRSQKTTPIEAFRAVPGQLCQSFMSKGVAMNTQKMAGVLGGIIGSIVLVAAFVRWLPEAGFA